MCSVLFMSCGTNDWYTERMSAASSKAVSQVNLYAEKGTFYNACFLDNIQGYSALLEQMYLDRCGDINGGNFPLTVRLAKEYFALGSYLDGVMVIHADSRHLAVYGHEYIRYLCQISWGNKCCDYTQSSDEWSGEIGYLWDQAETKAYQLCG